MRFGGWVDGVNEFDAEAFRMPSAEAAAIDPQARVLLELAQVRARARARVQVLPWLPPRLPGVRVATLCERARAPR